MQRSRNGTSNEGRNCRQAQKAGSRMLRIEMDSNTAIALFDLAEELLELYHNAEYGLIGQYSSTPSSEWAELEAKIKVYQQKINKLKTATKIP